MKISRLVRAGNQRRQFDGYLQGDTNLNYHRLFRSSITKTGDYSKKRPFLLWGRALLRANDKPSHCPRSFEPQPIMAQDTILGVGIIGGGGIAQGVHIPGYQKLDNVRVVGVSDPFEGARNACKTKFGIENTYADFEEMLANPDIHAVSVTTPTSFTPTRPSRRFAPGSTFCAKSPSP